jgi:hypothetical protein
VCGVYGGPVGYGCKAHSDSDEVEERVHDAQR